MNGVTMKTSVIATGGIRLRGEDWILVIMSEALTFGHTHKVHVNETKIPSIFSS